MNDYLMGLLTLPAIALGLTALLFAYALLARLLNHLGLFRSWHGPMSDEQLQCYRGGIYSERRVGPFAAGHWCRRNYREGETVSRWVRVGRVGGKGFTIGRAA